MDGGQAWWMNYGYAAKNSAEGFPGIRCLLFKLCRNAFVTSRQTNYEHVILWQFPEELYAGWEHGGEHVNGAEHGVGSVSAYLVAEGPLV